MTRAAFAIVAGLAIVEAGCGGGPRLREYSHKEDGFAVRFPGKPVRATQTTPGPFGPITYQVHTFRQGPVAYVVTANDLPHGFGFGLGPWDGPLNRLGGAVAGALAKGGKLVDQIEVTVCGHPGRELVITLPDGERYQCRMIVVGSKFYQVIVTAPADQFPTQVAREVLDSFTLLDYQGNPIRPAARQDVTIPTGSTTPAPANPPAPAPPAFSGGSFSQP